MSSSKSNRSSDRSSGPSRSGDRPRSRSFGRRPFLPGEPREPRIIHPAATAAERVLPLVCRVITESGRSTPADAQLRSVLRDEPGLTPRLAREASVLTFAYYRWIGWLEEAQTMADRVRAAARLQARYDENPASFPDDELCARAIPAWVNSSTEVTPAWVRSLQAAPRLWLRARAGQGAAVQATLGDCFFPYPELMPDTLEYGGQEDLFRRPEFHAGEFEIQDIASQLVGLVCDPQPGETWWDACAGEGGKTLHLSALMQNKGLIWASDKAEWRLRRLKLRARRAQAFNYRSVLWDGGERLPTRTKFDGILVDAPCSVIGTWQRNPHARWTTTVEDVQELARLQAGLLAHAAGAVKRGGRLIYAVCTLTRAETDEVVAGFESRFGEFTREPLLHPLRPAGGMANEQRFWPQDTGGNGMYVAAWRRKAAPP